MSAAPPDPDPAAPPQNNSRVALELLLILAALFALTVGLQWRNGTFENEFGSHSDEPAHYVTGLMIHDFATAGCPFPPMTFARDFYDHYPKVALGNWPPGFYVLQASWTLVFSPSPTSLRLLMALLGALLLLLLYRVLATEFDGRYGLVAVVAVVCANLYQGLSAVVMTELPVSLLCLLAVLCYGRYLESEKTRWALGFGLVAALAILTKGSGLMLALVPPIALLLTRRWALLKTARFWTPALIVALLAGPWTVWTMGQASEGWTASPSWSFTRRALWFYSANTVGLLGAGWALLAFIGGVRKATGRPADGRWVALSSLVAAALLFHFVVPCGLERRHLLPVLAPLAALAMVGLAGLLERFSATGPRPTLTAAALVATLALSAFEAPPRQAQSNRGFAPLAAALLEGPATRILIVSDAIGEGQFIAELARLDRRPGRTVLRSSKLLAKSSWSGAGYALRATNEQQLLKLIDDASIDVIVFDESVPERAREAHVALTAATLEAFPERFRVDLRVAIKRHDGGRGEALAVARIVPR